MAYTTRQERCPLGEIETWIFDLDNTLYPTSCRLFDQVQRRMNEYICDRLEVTPEEAAELRRSYFREHGTTLNGLMRVHNIDPHEFLAFVHEIDLAGCRATPKLAPPPARLSGARIAPPTGPGGQAERFPANPALAPPSAASSLLSRPNSDPS